MGRVRRGSEVPDATSDDPDRMGEDPEDGCPGGDQRCRFVQSVLVYHRRADKQRNRIVNPRLDRCEDDLVLDAVLYFEAEQDACAGYCDSELSAKLERERDSHGA